MACKGRERVQWPAEQTPRLAEETDVSACSLQGMRVQRPAEQTPLLADQKDVSTEVSPSAPAAATTERQVLQNVHGIPERQLF